jgi:CHAD domain-containing protein
MTTPRAIVGEGLRAWSVARRAVLRRGARRDDVHDWRVATRRMLAREELFAPARRRGRLERTLRRAFRAAGRLRDAQVCVGLAGGKGAAALASPDLERWLRGRLPKLRRRVLRRVKAVAPGEVQTEARHWLGNGGRAGASQRSRHATRSGGARVAAALIGVDRERVRLGPRSPATDLHRLRIRVKRARYLLEAAQAAGITTPRPAALRRLVAAQRRLGEIADLEALGVAAERRGRKAGPRDAEARRLQRAIEIRRARLCREFLARRGASR